MRMDVDVLCLRGRASLSLGPSLPIRLHQTERAASRQVTLLMASAGRDQAPYSHGLEACPALASWTSWAFTQFLGGFPCLSCEVVVTSASDSESLQGQHETTYKGLVFMPGTQESGKRKGP